MRRTKYFVLMLLVIGLALFAVGCGGEEPVDEQATNDPAEKTTWEQIQENGVMVIGLDDTFRPMGFRDENNDLVGFDIDMGKELENRLGIKVEWLPTEWEGITGSLNSKKFDAVINGMSITEDRQKVIAFSIPYVNASIGMAVTKDNEDIKTAADLEGKVIGTQSGSSGYSACQELVEDGILEEENIKLYSQYPEAFQDLEIGRIEAIVVDVTTAEDYVSKKPDNYKIVEEPLVADLYAIGLRQEDTALKEVLDNALKEMMEDGTLAEISKKWFDGKDMIAQPE